MKYTDEAKRNMNKIAALLDLEDEFHAFAYAEKLTLSVAESYIKGNTKVVCVNPEIHNALVNNSEFFDVLCRDSELMEWIKPFVLGKR
jgi:hypothetical protein